MKQFAKSKKILLVLSAALMSVMAISVFCKSDVVETANAECLLTDEDNKILLFCEGDTGMCKFTYSNGNIITCTGTKGSVSYLLDPVIVVADKDDNPRLPGN